MDKVFSPIEELIIEACRLRVKKYGLVPSVIRLPNSLGQRGFFKLTEEELRLALRLVADLEVEPDIDLYLAFQCNQSKGVITAQIGYRSDEEE